ncbi:MAG: hypothetical protein ACFE95_08450 [Candidatus Hodarchaeota archaeon]
MIGSKDLKDKYGLISILELDNPEKFKGKISIFLKELIDQISKYKAKRNLWEKKLKKNDDPRRPDFYAIMARLTMLDLIVADLDYLIRLLSEITDQIQ